MWSLPDINQMNERAAANAKKLKREANAKKKPNCVRCECFSRETPAEVSFLVHDIFSDDPKDVLHLCRDCVGQSGDPWEGYFTCDGCGRVMAENYTWERYCVQMDDRTLCLKCAAEEHFADAANWIDPRAVKDVVLEPRGPALFDSTTGVLNVARCPHVVGVKQPVPDAVKFVDNFEFDSMDGHQISGGNMLEAVCELSVPFCPILDAAYQFAVSIGLYVRAGRGAFAGLFTKAGDSRVLPVTFSKHTNLPRWAGISLDAGWEKGALAIEGNPLVQVPAALEEAA